MLPTAGQAAALVAYTAISLACTALVLSIAAPWGGNWWYALTLISPAAGAYYMQKADRWGVRRVLRGQAARDHLTVGG